MKPSIDELAQIVAALEPYEGLDQVLRVLAKVHVRKAEVKLRYPALELKELPPGMAGDSMIAVLNVFGDVAAKRDGVLSSAIARTYLIAKLAEELDVTECVAKKRLDALIHGAHLTESYGNVLFPLERLSLGRRS